jgi:hypothetical protein
VRFSRKLRGLWFRPAASRLHVGNADMSLNRKPRNICAPRARALLRVFGAIKVQDGALGAAAVTSLRKSETPAWLEA